MTANGDIANYSYRIEFQIRGMPHVHGVFWLKKEIIDRFKKGDEFDDQEVPKLIDKWITCSLDTGDLVLNKLVSEVNTHRHTKSCRRSNLACRFNFPRLPSKKTLIARPISSEFTEKKIPSKKRC